MAAVIIIGSRAVNGKHDELTIGLNIFERKPLAG
ncbi:Uncharacterised protein [Segatella copri]|nr:Uncharacterised protein [Segatella copri]